MMPCLNEEELLEESCASLGFGRLEKDHQPPEAVLILVDNGSTDRTLEVMEAIRRRSLIGSVLVVSEPERGYVPARHAGVAVAREMAERRGLEDLLVLQADADTIYSDGYVTEMMRVGYAGDRDVILEAPAVAPRDFRLAHPGFQNACRDADSDILDLANDDHSIVVADAASGYFLSRYVQWGGHRREYTSSGDELYAETSQLFVRAKLHGSARAPVQSLAFPSRRKVVVNPGMYFATAGFPRETAWRRRWQEAHTSPIDLSAFEEIGSTVILRDLLPERQAHLVILFFVLPALVNRAIDPTSAPAEKELIAPLLDACRPFGRGDLLHSTGGLFECSFSLLESHANEVQSIVGILRAKSRTAK